MIDHFGKHRPTQILFLGILFLLLTACGDGSTGVVNDPAGVSASGSSSPSGQVVTIYFAGTTMTNSMWTPQNSPFVRPETVATLHHFQKGWQLLGDGTEEPPNDPEFSNHHKGIIDGIGRGLQVGDAINPTLADLNPLGRGWNAIFNEARAMLLPVLGECEGKCITLNLVGFSRGAVSTMHFAQQILANPLYSEIKAKIKKTNILAFDPVPGDSLIDARYFNLQPDVEYLGFYAADERSALFSPVLPAVFPARPIAAAPPVTFFTVPGSHETMVGSIKKDGHSHVDLFGNNLGTDDLNLDHLSRTLKIVATEMMGSSDWGHVRFESNISSLWDLDWYDGATDIGALEQRFSKKIEDIYAYGDYGDMRRSSFTGLNAIGLLEAWQPPAFLKFEGCWTAGDLLPLSPDNPRCAYNYPGEFKGGLFNSGITVFGIPNHDLGLSNWGLVDSAFSDISPQLKTKNGNQYAIWKLIRERGSLDVDADMIDYNEDNCPTVFNPDQADEDTNGIGDACAAVIDNTPPVINLSVNPDTLWPPNHKMIPVAVTLDVTDDLDPDPTVVLLSITMNETDETDTYEPDYDQSLGDGNTLNDIVVDAEGNIFLRAERAGPGNGRIYTISYQATDAAGNTSAASTTVSVPHNQ